MLDNDDLTYSYQKRSVINNTERALITLERSQKLDLLLHLLANLQQSLIVCGPEGIGKTTLLETVRQNRKDMWEVVLLPASPNSSFESLINDLLRSLNIAKASAFDLSALRDKCAKQKVVLLIDDAGNLVPGLITMLIEFADSLPGLRLVLAMNHDQFHIKSGTDKLAEECHFIELPPLSKKQCGEYLQNLSAQPGAVVSFNAISDSLIEDLYHASNGIPGKILAQLPKLANSQSHKRSKLGLWLAIAGVVAGAGYALKSLLPLDLVIEQTAVKLPIATQPESATIPQPTPAPVVETVLAPPQIAPPPEPKAPEPSPTIVSAPASPATNAVESTRALSGAEATGQPRLRSVDAESLNSSTTPSPKTPIKPSTETIEQLATQTVITDKQTTPATATSPVQPKPEQQAEKPAPSDSAPPAAVPTIAKPVERKPATPTFEGSDQDWIAAQPAGNFTLQVMVLSSKDAALRFQKKYADYRDGLKFYSIKQGELEKYVVIYGSFQTAAEAIQLKAVMPGEFKQAVEKRFRAIQKESRR